MKRLGTRRPRRGQSIVELALILPFLVLITIGTIEFGWYVFAYSELENATRRSVEWAAYTPPWTLTTADDNGGAGADKCAVLIKEQGIDGTVVNLLKPENITISYPETAQRLRGNVIQVQVVYEGDWLTPIGQRFFGDKLRFNFVARRTIMSTDPPATLNPDCSDPTP